MSFAYMEFPLTRCLMPPIHLRGMKGLLPITEGNAERVFWVSSPNWAGQSAPGVCFQVCCCHHPFVMEYPPPLGRIRLQFTNQHSDRLIPGLSATYVSLPGRRDCCSFRPAPLPLNLESHLEGTTQKNETARQHSPDTDPSLLGGTISVVVDQESLCPSGLRQAGSSFYQPIPHPEVY